MYSQNLFFYFYNSLGAYSGQTDAHIVTELTQAVKILVRLKYSFQIFVYTICSVKLYIHIDHSAVGLLVRVDGARARGLNIEGACKHLRAHMEAGGLRADGLVVVSVHE